MEHRSTRGRRGWWTTLGVLVCAAVLLVASELEAAHFCDLGGCGATVRSSAAPAGNGGPKLCLICATAHQVSMASPVPQVGPNEQEIASAPAVAIQSLSRLQVFSADVRPPPQLL